MIVGGVMLFSVVCAVLGVVCIMEYYFAKNSHRSRKSRAYMPLCLLWGSMLFLISGVSLLFGLPLASSFERMTLSRLLPAFMPPLVLLYIAFAVTCGGLIGALLSLRRVHY